MSSATTTTTKAKTGATERMGLVPNSMDQKPLNSDSMTADDDNEMRNGDAPVAQPSKDFNPSVSHTTRRKHSVDASTDSVDAVTEVAWKGKQPKTTKTEHTTKHKLVS